MLLLPNLQSPSRAVLRSALERTPLLALIALACSLPQTRVLSQSPEKTPSHRLLIADSSKQRIAIIGEDGSTEWESKIGPLHDLHLLENGNLLFQRNWTQIVEVNPETNETVWQYDAGQHATGDVDRVEVHAFQRLSDGNTMLAISGAAKIIEIDRDGEIVHSMDLQVPQPHPHTDTRLVRKLESGNYLVCHESQGRVCEYAPDGEIVWKYDIPMFGKSPANGHGLDAFGNKCYAALRLKNGHTLISTGNGHSVIEVTPAKEVVWKLEQSELPDIQLAWVTTLQELPNGNLVIGNCHATKKNPQVIEITRDKQVVWTFHDFERFGNATTNTQVLTTDGEALTARLGSQR